LDWGSKAKRAGAIKSGYFSRRTINCMGKIRANLIFIGEVNYVPKIGEPVQLHVADGSWRSGFMCSGGRVGDQVWVSIEDEWKAAGEKGRPAAGAFWPITELAAI
jgi:hypothetical protein